MALRRGALTVRATATWLALTCLASVFVGVEACTSTDAGPCACDAAAVTEGPTIYTRCDVPVTSVTYAGVCGGTQMQPAPLVQWNGATYAEIVFMSPQQDGDCSVDVTFANGFRWGTRFTIAGQWEACRSDPRGCGEYLILPTAAFFIDACGNAPLYGPPDAGPDAGPDAALDAAPDAMPEAAPLEAGAPEASPDAGLDADASPSD